MMTFDQYITESLGKPFTWGGHDCVTFAVGWLSIRAGKDWLAPYPKWTSKAGALALRKQLGGIEAQFDKHLKRINPNFARDGDIALIKSTAFLFSGAQIVGPSKNGLIFIDRMEAECAWSL